MALIMYQLSMTVLNVSVGSGYDAKVIMTFSEFDLL